MSQHSETNPYFSQPPEQREGRPLLQVPPAQQDRPSAANVEQPREKERSRKQKEQVAQPDGRSGYQSPWWPLKPRPQPQGPQPDRQFHSPLRPSAANVEQPREKERSRKQKEQQVSQPDGRSGYQSPWWALKPRPQPQGPLPDGQLHSPWEPPHPHDEDHQHPGSISSDPQLQQPQVQLIPQPRRDRKDRSSQGIKPYDQGPRKQPGLVPPPPPPGSPPRDKKRDHHPQFLQPQGEERRQQPTSVDDGHGRGRHGLRAPPAHRTKAITWCGAVFCAIFSIIIFLGGLIVLIIYLLYRPRSPHFDIADVTLNTAYLDAGSLLNADVTIYANFTNPNRKMSVDFRNLILDLYYEDTLISTQYIVPFRVAKAGFQTAYVHMVTSQVALPLKDGQKLEDEIARNAVIFHLRGYFRVRSSLASFLKYSYKLHSQCIFMVTAPPSGVHQAIRCKSKR